MRNMPTQLKQDLFVGVTDYVAPVDFFSKPLLQGCDFGF